METTEQTRETGVVLWFNGYGFIQRDGQPDCFVHFRDIVGPGFRTLRQNEEVEFSITETERGPRCQAETNCDLGSTEASSSITGIVQRQRRSHLFSPCP